MFNAFWLAAPIIIFVVFMTAIFIAAYNTQKNQIVYDCRISEISPDFPLEVREACRKMRATSGRL